MNITHTLFLSFIFLQIKIPLLDLIGFQEAWTGRYTLQQEFKILRQVELPRLILGLFSTVFRLLNQIKISKLILIIFQKIPKQFIQFSTTFVHKFLTNSYWNCEFDFNCSSKEVLLFLLDRLQLKFFIFETQSFDNSYLKFSIILTRNG